MPALILTVAALRAHDACHLSRRLREYEAHHGHTPGRAPTLRSWLACTPDVADWLWATRCLGVPGRILGLSVACAAARRVLRPDADPRALRAIEAAEAVLDGYRRGAAEDEMGRLRAAAAADADAATYAARAATYAAAAATYAATAAADAAIYAAVAAPTERAQQRADFLAALDMLECT